jgi:hypothetical protein
LTRSKSVKYRTEAVLTNGKGNFAFGKEYWFSFRYRYADWAKDSSGEIAPFQIHNMYQTWTDSCQFGAATSTAPFVMSSSNDSVRFLTFGGKVRWQGSIQKNQWLNITVHFKISSGSDGYIEAWKDGTKLFSTTGANSYKVDKCGRALLPPQFKMGVYKWDWQTKTTQSSRRLMYIDNVKVAGGSDGYSMVTSGSADSASEEINGASSAPLSVTQDALIAHWPMKTGTGATTPDASGNGYTATLANGARLTDDGSVELDGVDDYVNAGKPDMAGKAMTVSAWILAGDPDNCPKQGCSILSKATGPAKQDQDLLLGTVKKGSQTRLRFRLNIDGATSNLTAKSGDIRKGEWVHVAAVFNGKKIRLYQDGIQVGSKVRKGSVTLRNQSPIGIGGNSSAAAQPWAGKISDVRLYNYALTPEEIAELAK